MIDFRDYDSGMFYLINPGGRIVEFNDEGEFNIWRNKEGFRVPEQVLVDEHIRNRSDLIIAQRRANEEESNKRNGLYFCTVSDGKKDGYGVSSDHIVKHLRRFGIETKTYYDDQNIAILYHNPYSIVNIESRYRMIYTMFESDKIPDNWVDYLKAANKVLVPSKWCQSVFKKAGVETTVVPLGYDDTVFRYIDRPIKRETHQTFNFLHYDAFNIRKGFPEVFKAFVHEFKQDEPVKLILKYRGSHPPLPIMPSQYPNIEVIAGQVEDLKMQEIIHDADCFVFPSRGEGFGITPLEAMATGLPTIVPNAHGITEYFNKDYMYEVKVKEKCPALYYSYKNQDVGKMVICDVDHLASQMRFIYEHEKEAKAKGKAASEYVKQWTFQKTAAKLKIMLDEIMASPLPDRPQSNILTLEKVS